MHRPSPDALIAAQRRLTTAVQRPNGETAALRREYRTERSIVGACLLRIDTWNPLMTKHGGSAMAKKSRKKKARKKSKANHGKRPNS